MPVIREWLGSYRLVAMVALVLPGAVATLGFYLLVSGRFSGVSEESFVPFVLMVPWQALGLTICKMGSDTWVLARTSADADFSVDLPSLVLRRIVPMTVALGVAFALVYSPLVALLLAASCLLDAIALVIAGEVAGRARYFLVAGAHLMRWPAFFVILAFTGLVVQFDLNRLLLLTVVLAGARLAVLIMGRRKVESMQVHASPSARSMGVQQVLNFGLFKNDQLAFSRSAAGGSSNPSIELGFVYLARFPELIAALVSAILPMVLRSHRIMRFDGLRRGRGAGWARPAAMTAILMLSLGAAIAAYVLVAPAGAAIHLMSAFAIALNAALILPSSLVTLRYLQAGRLGELNRLLILANAIGCVFAVGVYMVVRAPTLMFLWVVPIQLLVFVGLGSRGSLVREEGSAKPGGETQDVEVWR